MLRWLIICWQVLPRTYRIHRHCFTGSWADAQKWLHVFPESFIGVTPLVTQCNARAAPLRDCVKHIPLAKLLLETDSPYFVPNEVCIAFQQWYCKILHTISTQRIINFIICRAAFNCHALLLTDAADMESIMSLQFNFTHLDGLRKLFRSNSKQIYRGDSLHRFMSNLAGPTGTWHLAVQNFTSIITGGGNAAPKYHKFPLSGKESPHRGRLP